MIRIEDLSFTYPGSRRPALQGVNLKVNAGELCLVMGASGTGKSTLLRCINGLVPHFSGGSLRGSIRVNGLDPVALSPRKMSQTVGFVFQDPEAQFVVDRVEDEIAFSLENAASPINEMEARMEQALQLLELTALRSRQLDTLSGGERQRVAIAAALALRPPILVLDEPTSQLDPSGAEEVLQTLLHLNKEIGLTVVLAEHRLERVLPYATQIIYLADEFPAGISGETREVLSKVPLNPPLVSLAKALGWEPIPLTIEEAQEWARRSSLNLSVQSHVIAPSRSADHRLGKPAFIQARDVSVNFGKIQALRGINFDLHQGEITVMMGPNGAGKTTLLRSLVGLLPLQAGSIQVEGEEITGKKVAEICQRVGYLPQDPNALLFADTVSEELLTTLRNHHLDTSDSKIDPDTLLARLGLADKRSAYPRDLSTGERQRVAMGAVMVTHPGAILLDEPTRGLDYNAKRVLQDLLEGWRDEEMAILLVTHDVELAAQLADRLVILKNGEIIADGFPNEIMAHSPTFCSQVAKIFPGQGWINVKDALGGLDAGQH